jgi:hypothetical protein
MTDNCEICGEVTLEQLIKEHNSIHNKLNVFSKMNGEEAKWVTRILEGILKGE